jgi:hypothetical protein
MMLVRVNVLFLLLVIIVDSRLSVRNHGRRGLLNTIRIQPTVGEPWPQPQSIQTTAQQLAVHPETFHFLINETSQSCDLLANAFVRYYRAIFFPHTYLSYILRSSSSFVTDDHRRQSRMDAVSRKNLSNFANVSSLEDLYVNVQHPCDQWPSLESNESCNRMCCSFLLNCICLL